MLVGLWECCLSKKNANLDEVWLFLSTICHGVLLKLVVAAAVEFVSADTVQFPKHETQTMMHRKPPCTTSNARSYHSSYFTWPHLNLSQLISYRTRPCDVMRPSSSWLRPITAHSVQTKWGQFEMVWGEISDCTVHKSLSYNKRRF